MNDNVTDNNMTRLQYRPYLDAAWYVVVFLMVQTVVIAAEKIIGGKGETSATADIAAISAYSITATALFVWRRWTPVNRGFASTRPWFALFWVACAAIGTIAPASLITEAVESVTGSSRAYTQLFAKIMSHDLGYMAIGILAPIAEEAVFRGALLRRLLDAGTGKSPWVAITVSALAFGIVHGNVAQGTHAFVLGLLLGWMYCRTRSILPGLVLHWANNTVAFVLYRLRPDLGDATISQLYGGDPWRIGMTAALSIMILAAALYQLNMRLHTPGEQQSSRKNTRKNTGK